MIFCAMSEKDSEKPAIQIASIYNIIYYIALPCCTSNPNLMRLLSGTEELCGIEYFKLVFLKYLNVSTWSIFAGLVTNVLI